MYEWDDAKDDKNILRHGLGFETAIRIFDGPVFEGRRQSFRYGEVRENSIGLVGGVLCIVVTHTDRGGVIRIISARRANRIERESYAEAI